MAEQGPVVTPPAAPRLRRNVAAALTVLPLPVAMMGDPVKRDIPRTLLVILVGLLLARSASADVVWPALYLETRLVSWYAISVGLVVEWFCLVHCLRLPPVRALLVDIAMNTASVGLGRGIVSLRKSMPTRRVVDFLVLMADLQVGISAAVQQAAPGLPGPTRVHAGGQPLHLREAMMSIAPMRQAG
ncbi:MAG: hypothetical protein AB2L07_01250 [Thermoanaerobaculaceae bacterium]